MQPPDDSEDLYKLLATHRKTLSVLLQQQAMHTGVYVPPATIHSIDEARHSIRQLKTQLRKVGLEVEDRFEDEAISSAPKLSEPQASETQIKSSPIRPHSSLSIGINENSPHTATDRAEFLSEEIEHQRELIKIYTTRLRTLEKQANQFVSQTPEHISDEIDSIKHSLHVLNTEIESPELAGLRKLSVFLCYSKSDKEIVHKLAKQLESAGIDAWFDEDKILPGHDWQYEISQAVVKSDVVIVCLSEKALTEIGYMQSEINLAISEAEKKPRGLVYIIPIRLENCAVPENINKWQWLDYFEDQHSSFKRLIRALTHKANNLGLAYDYKIDNTEDKASSETTNNQEISTSKDDMNVEILNQSIISKDGFSIKDFLLQYTESEYPYPNESSIMLIQSRESISYELSSRYEVIMRFTRLIAMINFIGRYTTNISFQIILVLFLFFLLLATFLR